MGEKELSAVETELYDRQIRLWGIESQEKLRAANVLLIHVRGLGSEIAKDILLSGINSLTILDNGTVTKEEQLVNFLLTSDSLGQNIAEAVLVKAQALNPLVKLIADTNSIDDKDREYFKQFTVVISTKLDSDDIVKFSGWCRSLNVKFISADVFGMFGFAVFDFQEHHYFEDRVKLPKKRTHDENESSVPETTTTRLEGLMKYPDLSIVVKFCKSGKLKKCRNIFYYLMLVLLEFRNDYKRDPLYKHKEEDLGSLRTIWINICKLYEINPGALDEVFNLIFGEIVPICSIVGGVVAQEAIKAVSGKEVPINNIFLLNPLNYSGKEETVGVLFTKNILQ